MKKLIMVTLMVFLLTGCYHMTAWGIDFDVVTDLKSLTDIDCIIGYQMGASVGNGESLKNEVIRQEIELYVDENDEAYQKCYKLGLLANWMGTGDLIDLAKKLLSK